MKIVYEGVRGYPTRFTRSRFTRDPIMRLRACNYYHYVYRLLLSLLSLLFSGGGDTCLSVKLFESLGLRSKWGNATVHARYVATLRIDRKRPARLVSTLEEKTSRRTILDTILILLLLLLHIFLLILLAPPFVSRRCRGLAISRFPPTISSLPAFPFTEHLSLSVTPKSPARHTQKSLEIPFAELESARD